MRVRDCEAEVEQVGAGSGMLNQDEEIPRKFYTFVRGSVHCCEPTSQLSFPDTIIRQVREKPTKVAIPGALFLSCGRVFNYRARTRKGFKFVERTQHIFRHDCCPPLRRG